MKREDHKRPIQVGCCLCPGTGSLARPRWVAYVTKVEHGLVDARVTWQNGRIYPTVWLKGSLDRMIQEGTYRHTEPFPEHRPDYPDDVLEMLLDGKLRSSLLLRILPSGVRDRITKWITRRVFNRVNAMSL